MARKPQVRVSYSSDRGYLIRLTQSVEQDDRQTPEWRKEVVLLLTKLEQLFSAVDLQRLKETETEEA